MIHLLTIGFILLSAVCKAGADTLMFHFDSSVFRFKDPRFWNPNVSWEYAPFLKFTKYRVDAWHLFNSGMIVFFCLAMCFHSHFTHWWIEVPVAGLLFNNTFGLFFNHLFKK